MIQVPKAKGFVSFPNQHTQETIKPFTCPWDTVPLYSQLHCTAQKTHKCELCICAYSLCHTALTNKLHDQNQSVDTAVWESRASLHWGENCINDTLPHGQALHPYEDIHARCHAKLSPSWLLSFYGTFLCHFVTTAPLIQSGLAYRRTAFVFPDP